MNIIKDEQTGRKIEASKKVLGDETLNYSYLDINSSPFVPGRLDLLSLILTNQYSLWRYIVNINHYRDPFDLLEQSYRSDTLTPGKKFIKIQNNLSTLDSTEKSHPLDGVALF